MRCALALLILLIVPTAANASVLHGLKRLITLPYRTTCHVIRCVEIGYIEAIDPKAYWLIPYLVNDD